jgi:mannose-6-phosphate isomerase
MNDDLPREVTKPWGSEVWYAQTSYLLSGRLVLEQGENADTMRRRAPEPGAAWRNAPKVIHTIEALEDSVILEVSTPELHDVVRLGDRYGRPVEAPGATHD